VPYKIYFNEKDTAAKCNHDVNNEIIYIIYIKLQTFLEADDIFKDH